MLRHPPLLKKILRVLLTGAVLLISLYFLLRNVITDKIIERANTKLQRQYGLTLITENKQFTGYKTLAFTYVALVPPSGDTLLTIDSLCLNPSIIALLTFKLRINELSLNAGHLNLSCADSACNYSFRKMKRDSTEDGREERNYAKLFSNLYSKVFDIIPGKTTLNELTVSYRNDSAFDKATLINYSQTGDAGSGILQNSTGADTWRIEFTVNRPSRQFDFKIYSQAKSNNLPFLPDLFNLTFAFDTLQFSIGDNQYRSDDFILHGNLRTNSLLIFQHKLSDDSIRINRLSSSYDIHVTPASLSIDSTTTVDLNAIRIRPFIKYIHKESKDYSLAINTGSVDANSFFQSLPSGIFNATKGIEAAGNLSYSLSFHLNSDEPDSLQFSSEMKKEKFRLKKFGENSLLKMNTEFLYTAYEYDRPFRTFIVGPSNPAFTPLEQVSQYLRNAILTSEDGSFFFHNGFNEDAFRKSIATNYKEGKFKRGGSTISMQLIKNVYLTRHKTIERKAEEALLVWLIESNRLVSKERMFEVYLNIIELGPGIYGVGEASEFYFNKKPSQLSLSESIFIASLLPHPKWFKYSFDAQGNLKPYFADYYRVVSNFMLRKNLINQDEYDGIQPNVNLTGAARAAIIPTDSIPQEEDIEEESR
jgi:hypothetical protein